MSGQATGWVGKNGPRPDDVDVQGVAYGSRARGLRFVLMAVADSANIEGRHSHPGIANVAEFTLYSPGQARRLLTELVTEGWLVVTESGQGRHATQFDLLTDDQNPHLSNRAPCALSETANRASRSTKPRVEESQTAREKSSNRAWGDANRASGRAPNGLATEIPTVELTVGLSTRNEIDRDEPLPPDPFGPSLIPVNFEAFWNEWPLDARSGESEARKAWKAERNYASDVEMLAGLRPWVTFWKADRTEPRFIPRAANWLKRQEYKSQPPQLVGSQPKGQIRPKGFDAIEDVANEWGIT